MNIQPYFNLQTDTPEKVSLPFQPDVEGPQFAQFQGESFQATWFTAAPVATASPSKADDFSTATYVFFHIGWVFLVLGVGLMIVGPLFIPHPWTGFAVGIVLLVGGVGFWQCLLHVDNDETTQRHQEDHQIPT